MSLPNAWKTRCGRCHQPDDAARSAMTSLTLAVFALVYLGMALGRWPGLMIDRTGIALLGAILLFAGGVMDAAAVRDVVDFPTLAVLFGLMVVSAQFAASGFYDWCAVRLCRAEVSPGKLLAGVVAVAGGLSSVLANDVVVFAMTPILARGLTARGLDPRPYLIALAGAANAGSAATIIGNPQNILIGQVGGLDFWRFVVVCGPAAGISLILVWGVTRVVWRRELTEHARERTLPALPALDRLSLGKGGAAVGGLMLLFASPFPQVSGVLLVAGALLVSRRLATRRMLALVDWHLLVLFAGIFVVTAAFAATGLPERFLGILAAGGFGLDHPGMLAGVTLVGSNTIGNVPLVTLVLASVPAPSLSMLHGLALLSTLAGNLLVVGSFANIITVERAAAAGVRIGFADYARTGVPLTLLSFAAAGAWLFIVAPFISGR